MFTLESRGYSGAPEAWQLLAHYFEHTNTPPPAWFMYKVQGAEGDATVAIREAQDALGVALDACKRAHAALRDRAIVRLPWQNVVSELACDIDRAIPWGKLVCSSGRCRMSVNSISRNPQNHAKQISKTVCGCQCTAEG